jgi:hypothetical protein
VDYLDSNTSKLGCGPAFPAELNLQARIISDCGMPSLTTAIDSA